MGRGEKGESGLSAFYDLFMKPFEDNSLKRERAYFVSMAWGHVLEIGAGTGANLPFYDFGRIDKLTLTDMEIGKFLDEKVYRLPAREKIRMRRSSVENLPFSDEAFDTVVFTLVFCSVPDVERGLSEIRRVLKPGGRVVFIEHVLSDREPAKTVLNALTPVWKRVAKGCHLNRETEDAIRESGFEILERHGFLKNIFVAGMAEKK